MKINLLYNNPYDVRSGYINIDPFAQMGDPAGRISGDLNNLEDLVCANEATEIVAHDLLDKFPAEYVDQILDHWLSRLAHKGKLTVSVIDVYEVGKSILTNLLNMDQIQILLHGQPVKGHTVLTAFTLEQLDNVLSNKGYKVLKKFVENHRAIITVERP